MAEKPRLIFHSNAPWAGTGYGQQTALFAPRLAEHYNLTISAFYGLEGNVLPWNGIPVLPGVGSTYGNETLDEHARTVFKRARSGLVLSLMDVWVLDPEVWGRFNVAAWAPVDHEPAPPPVLRFFEDSAAVPIAMSKFGQKQLGDDALYVPHAVDTKVYKPKPQPEARKAIGMPEDAFIVGMVAANKGNPSRKCFSEAFQAFKVLQERHPEAKLYVHSEVSGRFQGVNLLALLDSVGVHKDSVIFCDQYRTVHFPFPDEQMANVYSSMDVFLLASAGEGFGLPVIEAQACGVPVVVSDFSSQPELVGAGWIVKGTKHYTPIGSWQFRPDPEDILAALESAYRMGPEDRKLAARKGRAHAEQYDIEHVMAAHMLPALKTAQERFDERAPVKVAA